MTILSWPAALPAPVELRFGIKANTQVSGPSPFTGTMQTLEYPGARWRAELRFKLSESTTRIMDGFLAALGGRAGRFTWSPPYRRLAAGAANAGEVVRVRTASQTGRLLDTTGWDGLDYVARQGDLVGFLNAAGRAQLHRVTADVLATDPTSTNLQRYSGAVGSGVSAGVFALGAGTTNGGSVADPTGGTGALRLGASSSGTAYIVSSLAALGSTAYSFGLDLRRQAGSGTAGSVLIVDQSDGTTTTRTILHTVASLAPGAAWARHTGSLTTLPGTTTLIIYWLGLFATSDTFDVFGMQAEPRATPTARIVTAGTTATRTQSISIPIAPPLRASPNANEPLVLSAPPAVWMLAGDENPMQLLPGLRGEVALTFEEALF